MAHAIVQRQSRDSLGSLVAFWSEHAETLRPDQLAWALRAASAADHSRARSQSVELVWTGPTAGASTLRRTEQALLEVIGSAQRSITLITFAAYRIPTVSRALLEAADRGVQIIFIAESPEASEGKVSFEGIQALGEPLRRQTMFYLWPRDKRPVDAVGRFGSLHAKCALADDIGLFVSSANLTDHALALNVELGVLIRGGPLPMQFAVHIDSLIRKKILEPVPLA
jgi:phosphatidylserine/phosphatidylglycerophosphate/cardiolipin synthase-like enzyme